MSPVVVSPQPWLVSVYRYFGFPRPKCRPVSSGPQQTMMPFDRNPHILAKFASTCVNRPLGDLIVIVAPCSFFAPTSKCLIESDRAGEVIPRRHWLNSSSHANGEKLARRSWWKERVSLTRQGVGGADGAHPGLTHVDTQVGSRERGATGALEFAILSQRADSGFRCHRGKAGPVFPKGWLFSLKPPPQQRMVVATVTAHAIGTVSGGPSSTDTWVYLCVAGGIADWGDKTARRADTPQRKRSNEGLSRCQTARDDRWTLDQKCSWILQS